MLEDSAGAEGACVHWTDNVMCVVGAMTRIKSEVHRRYVDKQGSVRI